MADFKVQRGTATIAQSATTAVITAGSQYTAPSALTKAFIRITALNATGCETLDSISKGPENCAAWISNPANLLTSITFNRTTGDVDIGINVDWEIVEYIGAAAGPNEFVVRGQEAIAYGGTSNTVNGAGLSGVVSDAKMCVFLTGQGSATGGVSTDVYSVASWNSGSDLATFTRDRNTGSLVATVSYAAVEFTGSNWTVQRVSRTIAAVATEETVSITSVGSVARAFVHVQSLRSHQVWLSSTTTVSFKNDAGDSTGTIAVAWVVSNAQTGTGTSVATRYTGTYANDGNSNLTVTAVADLVQTSLFGISGTNDAVFDGSSMSRTGASYTMTTTTNVRIVHEGQIGTSTYRVETFEWPTDAGGGGGGGAQGAAAHYRRQMAA